PRPGADGSGGRRESWRSAAAFCFFFQAEDGIRDWSVTGVQTCALPIYHVRRRSVARTFRRLSEPTRGRPIPCSYRCGSLRPDPTRARLKAAVRARRFRCTPCEGSVREG